MARPVPTPGDGMDHGAPTEATAPASGVRGRWCVGLSVALILGVGGSVALADAGGPGAADGAKRRVLSDEEVAALWERTPARVAAHRSYIFIDEADIVEGNELPLYRIEASRHGPRRQLERMGGGDAGLAARIADLAPELARETTMRGRSEEAFFSGRSSGARRDVPDTPDVVVGPLLGLFGRR